MGNERKYIDFKLYLTKAAGDSHSYQVSLLPTPEVGESVLPVPFPPQKALNLKMVPALEADKLITHTS